ncbi:MAG: exodeoxyribonuclease VII small subunit [Gemmatimonadetes bacterium]|nr:exodeoxyribonuclease VII small subunit [Gemmatimonadota bacterium]NNF39579.1 exodeoxyribonuclease VII small subunit [Gemmatimonadota bacterium]
MNASPDPNAPPPSDDADGAGASTTDDAPGLEQRLKRLESILTALEADEMDLERALALFEEGVGHVREAERILAETELRVEELLGEDGATRPLDGERA